MRPPFPSEVGQTSEGLVGPEAARPDVDIRRDLESQAKLASERLNELRFQLSTWEAVERACIAALETFVDDENVASTPEPSYHEFRR